MYNIDIGILTSKTVLVEWDPFMSGQDQRDAHEVQNTNLLNFAVKVLGKILTLRTKLDAQLKCLSGATLRC